ncbi:uncharacterized protein LOC110687105 [Chenopodium quinoa]|uniref:uncharacterized protein LOC110687105 n=1 Tax=Chenopodium quinoa TaxID=63459 RepID=UPI000B79337B|nr:uncharacterized protein LOC110687105 [Chenopodium quinoa]
MAYAKTVSDIRSFLGLAGYYRRFVKDFSKNAKPMTSLMKKDKKFEWDVKCEEAFQLLKQKLITAPVLTLLDDSGIYDVHSDASKNSLERNGVLQTSVEIVFNWIKIVFMLFLAYKLRF